MKKIILAIAGIICFSVATYAQGKHRGHYKRSHVHKHYKHHPPRPPRPPKPPKAVVIPLPPPPPPPPPPPRP
ncbi:MAG: hypothetical protein JST02_01970 [Bacteroidetes bacterium]|nr:hypothetical protein [Bacteroidota bacterium]